MTFHNLQLTANDNNWRLFTLRKDDPAFKKFQEKVFARDGHQCQFCGFRSKLFQEVVNLDHDYRNNRLSNLVTACPFCVQCLFLESVGQSDFGGGVLIYLPEMPQVQLNALCHSAFAVMSMGASYHSPVSNVYRSFKLRAQLVEKELGEGLNNPALLGRLLIEKQAEGSDEFRAMLNEKVRLLPNLSRYRKQIHIWALAGLNELVTV